MNGQRQVKIMANINGPGHRLATLICATALVTACGGSPVVRHYLIAPVPATRSVATLPAGSSIGLGPVSVPDYLSRPQMAVRTTDSRIEYRDTERWAEPLAGNLRRVLKENLESALPGNTVHMYPWPRGRAVDYQVRVEITRFDADTGGTVTLQGNWTLLDGTGAELVPGNPVTVSVPGTDASPDAVAMAHGAALSELADSIAAALVATAR